MPQVVTVREAVQRAKADGLPVSEYTLRRWIKTGQIPVRSVGSKSLIYYPLLVSFLQCADIVAGTANAAGSECGIRRVDV